MLQGGRHQPRGGQAPVRPPQKQQPAAASALKGYSLEQVDGHTDIETRSTPDRPPKHHASVPGKPVDTKAQKQPINRHRGEQQLPQLPGVVEPLDVISLKSIVNTHVCSNNSTSYFRP